MPSWAGGRRDRRAEATSSPRRPVQLGAPVTATPPAAIVAEPERQRRIATLTRQIDVMESQLAELHREMAGLQGPSSATEAA